MRITVGVITLNEESNIERCLRSIEGVADEILVVDSGSTDRTRVLAGAFGVRWESLPWQGYVGQKNQVLSLASHPWVLSLDADEALSPLLRSEILALKLSAEEDHSVSGYSIPRCVCYEGHWIRRGDWYPDRLVRLFRREKARFTGGRVHERLELEGRSVELKGELEHYSFRDAADHLARCRLYARLWAEDRWGHGKRCGRFSPYSHAFFRWFRGFILRGGIADGKLGLRIANYSAYEVFLKYTWLRELQRGHSPWNSPSAPRISSPREDLSR